MLCQEEKSDETPADGQHPIFSKDPLDWVKLVHTQVCATTEDGNQHKGWVYTVDPVSESIVLVNGFDSDSGCDDTSTISLRILIARTISHIEPLSTSLATDKVKQYCDRLFRPVDSSSTLSQEDILRRRSNLKSWLEKHRIPVSVGGHDGQSLSVLSDALIVRPPYTVDSCLSTNEIILSKIQELVKSMP